MEPRQEWERREEIRREETRRGKEMVPRAEAEDEEDAVVGSRYRVPQDPLPRSLNFAEIGRSVVLGIYPGFPVRAR